MAQSEQPQKKTMREMMPPRYLPTLEKRSGLDRKTIFLAVKEENRGSRAWPHIMKLAKEYEKQLEQERELGLAS